MMRMKPVQSTSAFILQSFLIALSIFALSCQKQASSSDQTQTDSSVIEGLSSNGNGRSYDGKLLAYQSRASISCDGNLVPEILIENNSVTNSFDVIKKVPESNGQCHSEVTQNAQVDEFRYSQLAAYKGQLNDKVLNIDDIPLDNQNTRIACKMNGGPLVLLDNWLSGVVVMESNSHLVWNSRLDFQQRSEKTGFMFDSPPPGELIQSAQNLEFVTLANAVHPNANEYQMIHVRIQRPYSDALSPSLNYGKKVYAGTFQYFYLDQSQTPLFSISTMAMPATCFVETISLQNLTVDLNRKSFDFNSTLVNFFQ